MMSALYVGLSGLVQSNYALNTTANNLANVNTDGYVRQQVVFEDTTYNTTHQFATNVLQVGRGVNIQEISHVRDLFLDAAYRKENGRESFYTQVYDSMYEVQTQLGELDDIPFSNTITEILGYINEVAKAPDDNVARAGLIQGAVTFLDKAKTIYDGLVTYQDNLNATVKTTVARINEIGYAIRDLNRQITTIEVGSVETASTLRDQRDLLLDELSGYVKMTADEEENGSVTVLVEGCLFCTSTTVSEIGLEAIEGTEYVTPVWTMMDNMPLYNMNATISTANNTDIGGLKGLLAARGTISPTYANMIEVPYAEKPGEDVDTSTPEGKAALEAYQAYEAYIRYTESASYSTLVNTIANFDKLVNGIVEGINNILSPMVDATVQYLDEDGNIVTYEGKILDMENTGMGEDVNATPGTELFSRKFTDRYTEVTGIDGNTYYLYNDHNRFGSVSDYSIQNIEVNTAVLQDIALLPLTAQDGCTDFERAKELVDLFDKDDMYYNGGLDGMNFSDYYKALVSDVANTGKVYQSMMENQEALTDTLDDGRQEVMGVSSDEELSNMIKYQQAYNASSRYINVITTMIDTVLNMV